MLADCSTDEIKDLRARFLAFSLFEVVDVLAHFTVSNVDHSQREFLKSNAPVGICVLDAPVGIQLIVNLSEIEKSAAAARLAAIILHVRVDSQLMSDGKPIPFDAEKIAAHLEQLTRKD